MRDSGLTPSVIVFVREQAVAHKRLVIAVTILVGFGCGLGLFQLSQVPDRPPTVRKLMRDLRRQETVFDTAWTVIWNLTPAFITSRIPSLEPRSPTAVRRAAAERLSQYGPAARRALPDLVRALRDSDYSVSMAALDTLRSLGTIARATKPDLIALFNDPLYRTTVGFSEARAAAGTALTVIAPDDPEVVSLLVTTAKAHQDADFQIRLIHALGMVPQPPPFLTDALLDFLNSTNGFIQDAAILALRNSRASASNVVPALVRVSERLDQEANVRGLVAREPMPDPVRRWVALPAATLLVNGATPAITGGFVMQTNLNPAGPNRLGQGTNGNVFVQAVPQPIPTAGPAQAGMSRMAMFRDDGFTGLNPVVSQLNILMALAALGPAARDALPMVIRQTTNRVVDCVSAALYARWKIEGDAEAVLPIFRDALNRSSERKKIEILRYLKEMGPVALPLLLGALNDPATSVRLTAISYLEKWHRAAAPALEALEDRLRRDSKFSVRRSAWLALCKVAPDKVGIWDSIYRTQTQTVSVAKSLPKN